MEIVKLILEHPVATCFIIICIGITVSNINDSKHKKDKHT